MKIRTWFLLAATAAAGCGGYYAPDDVTFGNVVYTQQAPGATFTALRTYYLDPLMEVWEDGTQQLPVAVPSSTATTVDTEMTKKGYTKVTANPSPGNRPSADTGLRLVYLKSNFTYYTSGGYCSVYWAYYACWPGWAYAGSYSTGTVLMMMVDTKVAPPTTSVLWTSALYAILRGSSLENTTILNTAITTAFAQSPYLKTSAVP